MFWVELFIILFFIFLGVRKGGPFLAMAGGLGMFIMVFVLHVKPSDPPVSVILIMIAVICAASMLQACGGLDLLVRIAERLLRRNPKLITIMAPLVAWVFTFMCGTGHIIYSLLPVINEIAVGTNIRPERPIAASIISSQFAITACPLSAATVAMLAFISESDYAQNVNMFALLSVAIVATLLGTLCAALVMLKKGRELGNDPEFIRRVASGEILRPENTEKKEVKATSNEKCSVTIFLLAMASIVTMGAMSKELLPVFTDNSKLPLTTVIEMFMLVAAALMVLICRVDSNKLLDMPVFKTGMFAVILAFGLCWMVNTFIGDQAGFITENMSDLTNHYPWIYIIAVFTVGAITTSQASTTMIMVPIGIALNLPAYILVAGWLACNSNFFIPASGQCVAAIAFDSAGTTKIGKYLLNHSYMLPGMTCTIISVASALILGSMAF